MAVDPQVKTILDQISSMGGPQISDMTPPQAREMMRAMRLFAAPGPEVAKVEERRIPGAAGEMPVRVYTPNGSGPFAVLTWFHGGGWVIGDLETADATCRELCAGAGCVVVSVDYRLAPESRYPAAAEDCYAATKWVAANATSLGVDARRHAVGGDSAGGNLAAVIAQMARDRGGPALRFQLLVYPVTDANFETPSYRDNAEGYLLTRDSMRWFWNHYVPSAADRGAPYASPLKAKDQRGLPPALTITATYDPLRDEGEAYAARLREADVPSKLSRYDGMIHGFFTMTAVLDRAKTAVSEACEALRQSLR